MSCCSVPPYCSPVAEDATGPLINMPGGEFPTTHLSIFSVMGIWVVSGVLPSYHAGMTVVGAYLPEATSEAFFACWRYVSGRGKAIVHGLWMARAVIHVSLFSRADECGNALCTHNLVDIWGCWTFLIYGDDRADMGPCYGLTMHSPDP